MWDACIAQFLRFHCTFGSVALPPLKVLPVLKAVPLSESLRSVRPSAVPHGDPLRLRPRQRCHPDLVRACAAQYP